MDRPAGQGDASSQDVVADWDDDDREIRVPVEREAWVNEDILLYRY